MPSDDRYYANPEREQFIWERYQVAAILSRYPALTLKVVFRWRVGLRRAEPSHLFLMTWVLLAIWFFAAVVDWVIALPSLHPMSGAEAHRPHFVPYFALAVLVAGLWQHRCRWRELRGGTERWHTYSDGISPFELVLARITPDSIPARPILFSPAWWLSEARITRFVDPLVLFAVGYFLYPVDWALALWIMFASGCLAIDESLTWRKSLKAYLDLVDSQINAEAMKQWIERKSGTRKASSKSRPFGLPVPTGIGEDLRGQLEAQTQVAHQKRQELRAQRQSPILPVGYVLNAPDNLAPSERLGNPSNGSRRRHE